MAKNKVVEERVKSLVAALLAEEEAEGLEGRPENINDIENAMVRIGDMVAREVGIVKVGRHTAQLPERPPCPKCGHAGVHLGTRTRDLITRRGEIPLTEAKYRCPKCRRHFFPSDRRAGD
jgi:transposase